MNNLITISALNPMPVYVKARTVSAPQYNYKFREDFLDREGRKPWQSVALGNYFQKWQTNDTIRYQWMSNVAPIKLMLYSCRGVKILELAFTQKQKNRYIPDMFIYEANLALNDVRIKIGRYYIEFEIGGDVAETLTTDYFDIAERWPNTVLMEYKNSFYWADAIFGTGWSPSFRVEGWFKMKPPASKDELYTDQSYNQRMLFSDPYIVEEFIVGPASGTPDWTPELLNWVLGCDEVYIDGKQFTKADGAKFAEDGLEGYPYRGWTIDLQPTNRRSSKQIIITPTVGGKSIFVTLNVEAEGFADTTLGNSSNVIQITSVE